MLRFLAFLNTSKGEAQGFCQCILVWSGILWPGHYLPCTVTDGEVLSFYIKCFIFFFSTIIYIIIISFQMNKSRRKTMHLSGSSVDSWSVGPNTVSTNFPMEWEKRHLSLQTKSMRARHKEDLQDIYSLVKRMERSASFSRKITKRLSAIKKSLKR